MATAGRKEIWRAMYSENRDFNLDDDLTAGVMDGTARLEAILDDLCSGVLAKQIAEAARLAVEEHLRQEALEIQSAFEAENSKK